MALAFDSELWQWEAQDGWFFVTLPEDVSDDVRLTSGPPRGFGSVRVEASIGRTTWRTSVFPDKRSGCFVLPVKRAVRRAEDIEEGDVVRVELELL